jgi:hypothetical protein
MAHHPPGHSGVSTVLIWLVMMVAWAGMAVGGYVGGVRFDVSRSYTLAFLLAGAGGVLNVAIISAFAARNNLVSAQRAVLRSRRASGSRRSPARRCRSTN